jgi:hypothetical protein
MAMAISRVGDCAPGVAACVPNKGEVMPGMVGSGAMGERTPGVVSSRRGEGNPGRVGSMAAVFAEAAWRARAKAAGATARGRVGSSNGLWPVAKAGSSRSGEGIPGRVGSAPTERGAPSGDGSWVESGGVDPAAALGGAPGEGVATDAVASGEVRSVVEGSGGGRALTAPGPGIAGEVGADGRGAACAAVAGIVRVAAGGALCPSGEGVPCTVGDAEEARTGVLDTGTEGEVGAGERPAT